MATNLNTYLKNVAVLGAAGKMGSGISLLLLEEMARLEAEQTAFVGPLTYHLHLIDTRPEALDGLKKYLRTQILKFAEKNINALRKYFAKNPALVSNEEIIDHFVTGALDIVRLESTIESAKPCSLIFEAVVENIEAKVDLFKKIASPTNYILTNTSSIPISLLNEKANLNHRIIGCHFYNPPAIQRLIEIIPESQGNSELTELTIELAKRLNKTVVISADTPGFIGNGHFLRDIHFATQMAEKTSIPAVNKVTQDYLLRPMGIFQLLDYVGLDVAQKIAAIMKLNIPVIDKMVKANRLGGQNADGSQKDGFFHYEKNKPVSLYSFDTNTYEPIPATDLGPAPTLTWKQLQKDPNKKESIKAYLDQLKTQDTPGAQMAREFLANSRAIADQLVADKVASSLTDVDKVLELGFYHPYGPCTID